MTQLDDLDHTQFLNSGQMYSALLKVQPAELAVRLGTYYLHERTEKTFFQIMDAREIWEAQDHISYKLNNQMLMIISRWIDTTDPTELAAHHHQMNNTPDSYRSIVEQDHICIYNALRIAIAAILHEDTDQSLDGICRALDLVNRAEKIAMEKRQRKQFEFVLSEAKLW